MIGRALARQGSRPSGLLGRLTGHFLNRETRNTNRVALVALDPQPGEEVLEIGFGGGATLSRLLAVEKTRISGLELSETMVAQSNSRFRREIADSRLDLTQGDVAALPYADGSFDKVLTVNTIYFWTDPAAALNEIGRTLRPGGRIVIGFRIKEKMEQTWFARYGYHRLYEEEEVRRLLERGAFDDVQIRNEDGVIAASGTKPSIGDRATA